MSLPTEALPQTGRSAQAPHIERLTFQDFDSFQRFFEAHHSHWPDAIQRNLRLMALNGILDPISGTRLAAESLEMNGTNLRETLSHSGVISRHRAVLLEVQMLMDEGLLPAREEIEIYCPERLTAFAQQLQSLFPRVSCSEFFADATDPRRATIPHQDLCALSFAQASFDLVLCNDLFEHLYDLPAALREIARVLRPGGWLISTFPLAYWQHETIVKAIHQEGAVPGIADQAELLCEPEFHGDPVNPEQGSLVYQIPGWDLLEQVRDLGFIHPCFRWINAPSYGVIGKEIPAVIVLVAQTSPEPAHPSA